MITPVWGAPYIERWLGFCFASLRSEGNIPYLNEHCDFELAIVTKSADAAYMQESPRFHHIMTGIRVRFILMDEFFPRTGHVTYGVPLTLAYAKAIADLGDKGVGTFVMLMNADCVLASGSLESIVQRIRAGDTIIVGQSLRAVDGSARDRLLARVDEDGVLAIEPRKLMQLVNAAMHSTVTARIVNEPGIVDANYYHQIFWRISDDCLAMRAFMLHPICFRIDRKMEKAVCPMDYGFLLEMCPEGRFGVLDDSDDFLIIELQHRDSESHLLRVAPRSPTLGDRLSRLHREIAEVAATWTTAEHRRSVTRTLYFHQGDLPRDLSQQVAVFEGFVESILAQMPPPVSHTGHPHWLGAIRCYREDMVRGGSDPANPLLDHPLNRTNTGDAPAQSMAKHPPEQLSQPVTDRKALRGLRKELGNLIRRAAMGGPTDVVYIGDIASLAPLPPLRARRLHHPDPDQSGMRQFNVRLPITEGSSRTLIIYVTAGFLWRWDRLDEDLERFLERPRRVILVLITDRFRPLEFATHSYLLSILATSFPPQKFVTNLEVYSGRSTQQASRRSLLRFMRARPQPTEAAEPPATFSALVISIQSRAGHRPSREA